MSRNGNAESYLFVLYLSTTSVSHKLRILTASVLNYLHPIVYLPSILSYFLLASELNGHYGRSQHPYAYTDTENGYMGCSFVAYYNFLFSMLAALISSIANITILMFLRGEDMSYVLQCRYPLLCPSLTLGNSDRHCPSITSSHFELRDYLTKSIC